MDPTLRTDKTGTRRRPDQHQHYIADELNKSLTTTVPWSARVNLKKVQPHEHGSKNVSYFERVSLEVCLVVDNTIQPQP